MSKEGLELADLLAELFDDSIAPEGVKVIRMPKIPGILTVDCCEYSYISYSH